MTIFGQGLATAYDRFFGGGFAEATGQHIVNFYRRTPIGQVNKTVLDVGCGTGQLVHFLLQHGYQVTGIDLSQNMLEHAQEHAAAYVATGQARFLQADITEFTLPETFGLIVSTFEVFNHLPGDEALRRAFQNVFAMLANHGYFIFDLLMPAGLARWESTDITLKEHGVEVSVKGNYDGRSNWATMTFSGVVHTADGIRQPFSETIREMAFEPALIEHMLRTIGWRSTYFARREDLATPIAIGELDHRLSVVALK